MEVERVSKYRIVLIALSANLCSFSTGTYMGWTSPTMPKLRDPTLGSPLVEGVSTSQEGWISSLTAIGALSTALIGGRLAAKIGRKRSLFLCAFFMTTAYILLITTRTIWLIYLARYLQGCGGGLFFTVLPIYIGEIATADVRGSVGSLTSFFLVGGIVYVYCIGPFVSYWTLQWSCLAAPVIFFLTFAFLPESPYFLAMKGRTSEGIKNLQYIRGQSFQTVKDEMIKIQSAVDNDMRNGATLMDILRSDVYRKAIYICSGLFISQQLVGTAAITYNSQSIFASAGSSVNPALATILLGVAQLSSNFLTPFVVEHAGRKIILLIATFGMFFCLMAIGTFFYIQKTGDASAFTWVPVPALILFNLLLGFGLGPIPYVMMGEMLPTNIKSKASTITISLHCSVNFLMIKFYPTINALGPYYAFWGFSGLSVLVFCFVLFFTIETKGLTLESIQEKLNSKKNPKIIRNDLKESPALLV